MAKKITAYIKLQVKAGQANPSPPVGPALGQHGVNIMEFYNWRVPEAITRGLSDLIVAGPDYPPKVMEPIEDWASSHLAVDLAKALVAAGKTDAAAGLIAKVHWKSFFRIGNDPLDRADDLADLAADQFRLGLTAEAQQNLDKAYALFAAAEDTPAQKTWTIAKLTVAAMTKPD